MDEVHVEVTPLAVPTLVTVLNSSKMEEHDAGGANWVIRPGQGLVGVGLVSTMVTSNAQGE